MKNTIKTIYKDIDYWASLIDESIEEENNYRKSCKKFMESKNSDELEENDENNDIDEAGEMFKVDDNYVKQATAALAPLKSSNPDAYAQAMKYLNYQKGKNLVVSPEDFAKRRIDLATQNDTHAQTDTRSVDQQRADLMKSVADKRKADLDAMDTPKEQHIKSVWVKSIDDKDNITLELTFMDGKTEQHVESMVITDGDKYYKQVAQALRSSRRINNDPRPVTKKDVQLSMIRVAYTDPRITWYYGKSKIPESQWKYTQEIKKHARNRRSELMKAYEMWKAELGIKKDS